MTDELLDEDLFIADGCNFYLSMVRQPYKSLLSWATKYGS
jgi:hypothetical protein